MAVTGYKLPVTGVGGDVEKTGTLMHYTSPAGT